MSAIKITNDWNTDPLHDVLVEVNGRSYSEQQLRQIFYQLPRSLQIEAMAEGFDTVSRDEIYLHLKRHGVPNV